jgi:hypothetical protein
MLAQRAAQWHCQPRHLCTITTGDKTLAFTKTEKNL